MWGGRPSLRFVFSGLGLAICCLASTTVSADVGDDLYHDGHYQRAIAWWREAAPAGNVSAAYRLGVVYADGVVVARDCATAARWFRLAAERGDRRAQFDLATLYDAGCGVERSYERAARWYRAAAERGEMASQYNLAGMYEQGQGVERDLVEAYKWYYLAARQGFVGLAPGELDRLAGQMQGEQIERGVRAALAFEAAESSAKRKP